MAKPSRVQAILAAERVVDSATAVVIRDATRTHAAGLVSLNWFIDTMWLVRTVEATSGGVAGEGAIREALAREKKDPVVIS